MPSGYIFNFCLLGEIMKSFNTISTFPSFIGMERLARRLEGMVDNSGFPPYNVVKHKDTDYRIEMALAGIPKDNIDIELKDNSLTVSYTKENHPDLIPDENQFDDYIYSGIARRNFSKKFELSENMIVGDIFMDNGILTINIKLVIPEEKKTKKLSINNKPKLING
jgi:molecular chaperone IbpA